MLKLNSVPAYGGDLRPSGKVKLKVIHRQAPPVSHACAEPHSLTLREIVREGFPRFGLSREVNFWRLKNIRHLLRGVFPLLMARAIGVPCVMGQLFLTVIRANGERVYLGLASNRVVTTAGVNYLVDALQNLVEPENLKFHGIGTGTNAEAAGDTALQTELTTQYNPDNTRATGSLTEGASANIFRTVGTNTVDASAAITEHGIFSQAATGGGTLLDRSVFSAVNLANGDSLQSTYDLTINSGG